MLQRELPIVTEGERQRILALGHGKRRPYERYASITDLFTLQAQKSPDVPAVIDGADQLTYAQLEARSNQVARYLSKVGVAEGTSVGVALERSLQTPIAVLAILKAGAAYVPLDPSYPRERLQFMLDDAEVAVVLTSCGQLGNLPPHGSRIVDLEFDGSRIGRESTASAPSAVDGSSLAYIIFTSGSTGRPKGVAVEHRGVTRLVRNTDYARVRPTDVFLHCAPLSFDASTFEIWAPLLNGARLAIPRAGLLSIPDLLEAIERFGVTTLFLTTLLFQKLIDADPATLWSLRCLFTGGEVASPAHMRRFLERFVDCRLVAVYGPTENTTFSTWYDVTSYESIRGGVPIGRPIANSSAYVLDADLQPLPFGTEGELCVGGDGVARGYVNLPELTEERFVADPFTPEGPCKLYRTGDNARLRSDGVIEFLGRSDDQVKIRGFRIELGEIESVLREMPGGREAAVVVADPLGEKVLFGFVVPEESAVLDERSLREHLGAKLPQYMVPHRLSVVKELPQTSSAKVDRAALKRLAAAILAPCTVAGRSYAVVQSPAASLQGTIARAWRETLVLDRDLGLDENFFDAGGDSLRLLSLHARLQEALGVRLAIMDLFEQTTIRKQVRFVERLLA